MRVREKSFVLRPSKALVTSLRTAFPAVLRALSILWRLCSDDKRSWLGPPVLLALLFFPSGP